MIPPRGRLGSACPCFVPMESKQGDVLVLGLGNELLSDDAVGLQVVRALAQAGPGSAGVDLRETSEMGLALLDWLVGYRAAILVDSIQTGKAPPGTVHELEPIELGQLTGRTPHFLGVAETLALGRQLGLPMPEQIRIIAVEVADPFTLGTSMTPAVQQAVPEAARRVRQLLQTWANAPHCPGRILHTTGGGGPRQST